MKVFVELSSGASNAAAMFSMPNTLVVGAESLNELDIMRQLIEHYPDGIYTTFTGVFVFKYRIEQGQERFVLTAEYGVGWETVMTKDPAAHTFTLKYLTPDSVLSNLWEVDKSDLHLNGWDRILTVGATVAAPQCDHEPGATRIFGRLICKKCGNDLE